MNPQIAAQFLGTMAQVSVTILAIYIAVITYILQDKDLGKRLINSKPFLLSFGFTCLGYSSLIVQCFIDFLKLDLQEQYSDTNAFSFIFLFCFSLCLLFGNFLLVMSRRRKFLNKRRQKDFKKEKKE